MNIIKGLKGSNKGQTEYESVEDQRDLKIPVQNEDAFKHGIIFKAKYIGTQEITRPGSRVEIVSAMRRIRYEYKYRNIKKRKVNLDISVDGIRVTIWKKKKSIDDGKYEESHLFVMCYPINRVFYVSHDSQDLLIFSYIARGDDGIFRCSVFKSFKKSQAMSIVRTIGQAFEVCHKINQEKSPDENDVETKEQAADISVNEGKGETDIDDVGETDIDDAAIPETDQNASKKKESNATFVTDIDKAEENTGINRNVPHELLNGEAGSQKIGNVTLAQLQQFYAQQLRHQIQEADAAKAEVALLRQQLRLENETRKNTQVRVDQLLAQNRELLVTIQKLMWQVQNAPAKDVFDPIDESWMTSSIAITDSFLPTMPSHAPPQDVTNDCISKVYDNAHHQSIDFDSAGITSSNPHSNNNSNPLKQVSNGFISYGNDKQPFLQSKGVDVGGSFSDLRKGERVEGSAPIHHVTSENGPALGENMGEKHGGLSTSFSDLRKAGTSVEKVDVNHNSDRVTKFERNTNTESVTNDIKPPDTELANTGLLETGLSDERKLPTAAVRKVDSSIPKSELSKEMMETFSQELNELESSTWNSERNRVRTQSSVTDL